MSDTENRSSPLEGYLVWGFISGLIFISICMAAFTTTSVMDVTGFDGPESMGLGAFVGILLTAASAFILEQKSR